MSSLTEDNMRVIVGLKNLVAREHERRTARFMKFWPLVEAVAQMSKDPSTKVGALALDDNLNIIATGYNGFPRGVDDAPERYADRETKLRLVSHAEQNLIAQAAYGGRSLKGATLLVSSLFPCSSCAKSIIQAGVARIISPPPDESARWAEESKWAKLMFDEAGIEQIFISDRTNNSTKQKEQETDHGVAIDNTRSSSPASA